ncbi:MAG: C-GCAxxG-C-C family protein [Lachnospiraceae bacterium]|nr:C-GCAxxG-C-C family protein [Lachnospiraceae bacterium]
MILLTIDDINWERSSEGILRAEALFMSGYNCCQSVFAAFAPRFGIKEKDALKLSCSLGGGVGRMREICGAVSGMSLLVSLCNGNTDPDNSDAKEENYRTVRMLADLFRQKHNSIICRELLGLEKVEKTARPNDRTQAYYASRPCPQLVKDAAIIMEHYLDLYFC